MKKAKILYFLIVLCLMVPPLDTAGSNTEPDQAAASSQEYVFRRSWGGEGEKLFLPQDVAVGLDGRIYVLRHN